MTTIDAQALIRKASNGAELNAFLDIIAAAAAAGTLTEPEATEEADEEAPEAEYDEEEPEYDEELAAI